MKTKITFLSALFLMSLLPLHGQTKLYVAKTNGARDSFLLSDLQTLNFTPSFFYVEGKNDFFYRLQTEQIALMSFNPTFLPSALSSYEAHYICPFPSIFVFLQKHNKKMVKRKEAIQWEIGPFCLIGIKSPNAEDYQLAWSLNKCLHLNLCKMQDFPFDFQQTTGHFSFYYDEDNINRLTYHLIKNSVGNTWLFPRYQYFDYWLLVAVDNDQFDPDAIIRNMEFSDYIFETDVLNTSNVQAFDHLVYQLEEEMLERKKVKKYNI